MTTEPSPPLAAWPDPVRPPAAEDARSAFVHETKLLPQAPEASGETGVFEGYASLFGVPDLAKDVVAPGAFSESLARRGAAGVRLLWQHDPAEPLGRWLSVAEDSRGLHVRGRLNLAVERAREIHALLREGRRGRALHRLPRRAREGGAGHRPAPAGEARPVGDLRRHLPHAAGSAGERGEAGGGVVGSGDPGCGEEVAQTERIAVARRMRRSRELGEVLFVSRDGAKRT